MHEDLNKITFYLRKLQLKLTESLQVEKPTPQDFRVAVNLEREVKYLVDKLNSLSVSFVPNIYSSFISWWKFSNKNKNLTVWRLGVK